MIRWPTSRAAVRYGRSSASELVEMSLDRIERLDPPLNAVIRRARAGAGRCARVDARLATARTSVRSPGCPSW